MCVFIVCSIAGHTFKKESPSHVLLAIGKSEKDAYNSIRLSLGKDNSLEECEEFIKVFKEIISSVRG